MKTLDKKELNVTELDKVSGGYVLDVYFGTELIRYEVINDDTLETIECYPSNWKNEAEFFARYYGFSDKHITEQQLRMMKVKGPKIGELPEIKGPQIGNPPMGQ